MPTPTTPNVSDAVTTAVKTNTVSLGVLALSISGLAWGVTAKLTGDFFSAGEILQFQTYTTAVVIFIFRATLQRFVDKANGAGTTSEEPAPEEPVEDQPSEA